MKSKCQKGRRPSGHKTPKWSLHIWTSKGHYMHLLDSKGEKHRYVPADDSKKKNKTKKRSTNFNVFHQMMYQRRFEAPSRILNVGTPSWRMEGLKCRGSWVVVRGLLNREHQQRTKYSIVPLEILIGIRRISKYRLISLVLAGKRSMRRERAY